MHQRKEDGNFPSMTKIMFEYYRKLEKYEGNTESNWLETKQTIVKEIDALIKELSTD